LILDANPILEAFGNAKTIRNNNSSRFGKFIEVHYSHKFQVTGGLFHHYLLEKSRICTQSEGERNYHIFYQLCACLPENLWQQLELNSPDYFHYLNGGCTRYFCSTKEIDQQVAGQRKSSSHKKHGAIQDQLIDDVLCYQQTDRALTNFSLSDGEKFNIYSIVAAVLHLGNVSFCPDDPDDNRDGCRISNEQAENSLKTVSRLLGLDFDLLKQALVSRIMSTARGGHKGTVYMVQLSVGQAQAARDALAKAIYSKLFDYIVTKIVNKSIPFAADSCPYYIGVLDVAGFEYFQHNSFEQFLINFCNEKLQQFFNERILKEEQNIYEAEGLNLPRVEFIDNQDCINLFECKATGMFDLLDEESRLPKPNAQHFTQSVHQANKDHFRLGLPRTSKLRAHRELRDDEGFLIRHFAGAVCYETQSFIEKNNDALHTSLKVLMVEAENPLMRELFCQEMAQQNEQRPQTISFQSAAGSHSSNKLNFISVASTFRSQLGELMSKLQSTGSHFIRCIKPNSEMVAHKFEGGQILSQLHCSGMDSVLKLMQQGYPSRLSFNNLYQAYAHLLPPKLVRLDSHLFCRALFKAIGLNDEDFRFGSSKVFFKPSKFAEFDEIIRTSDEKHMAELVGRVSKWLLRQRWRKIQYCSLSVIKLANKIIYRREQIINLQKHWRAALVSRQVRFRLDNIRKAKQIESSLRDFEQITREKLSKQSKTSEISQKLDEESRILRDEVEEFVCETRIRIQQVICGQDGKQLSSQDQINEAKKESEQKLDKIRTKRDLLVRSISDKLLAKQRELAELERQVSEERLRREQEEIARQKEEQLKLQRQEMEMRRKNAEKQELSIARNNNSYAMQKSNNLSSLGTNSIKLSPNQQDHMRILKVSSEEDQENRDRELAMRLGNDGHTIYRPTHIGSRPLAPSENLANDPSLNHRFDLTKWKYSDLRDTINTSCDLELLEACKREFHRRLKVYHAWRALNSGTKGGSQLSAGQTRAPNSVLAAATGSPNDSELGFNHQAGSRHRFFRIPFVKPGSSTRAADGISQRGWWFAHFDGQWIARQLELHPGREPILLVAGEHDMDMCELSLSETRLTSKRGAEILAEDFEAEWVRYGGKPYHIDRARGGP